MENISKDFKRSDFACKCGCGFDDIDLRIVDLCQRIKDKLNSLYALIRYVVVLNIIKISMAEYLIQDILKV